MTRTGPLGLLESISTRVLSSLKVGRESKFPSVKGARQFFFQLLLYDAVSKHRRDSPYPLENKEAHETWGHAAEFVCLSFRERAQNCHVFTDMHHVLSSAPHTRKVC